MFCDDPGDGELRVAERRWYPVSLALAEVPVTKTAD